MSLTVSFITLGCAKNEVDSDKMRARLDAAGFVDVADSAQADFVIVNTCSFITEATEEAVSTILEALDLPKVAAGESKLIVAGCLPARYGTELEAELPEVAAFVSCADEDNIVGILESLAAPVILRTAPSRSINSVAESTWQSCRSGVRKRTQNSRAISSKLDFYTV